MRKSIVITILFTLFFCVGAHAQGQYRKPLKSSSHSKLGVSNYNIGLKFGCPWSYIDKSDLQETSIDGNYGYLIGLIGERNLGKWSIALEGTLAQRGTKMHNEKGYQISMTENGILRTEYELAYNVVAVRLPITYYFKGMIKDDKVIPYLFAGPEIDIPLPFNFDLASMHADSILAIKTRYDGPEGKDFLDETRTSITPMLNVSIAAGIGLMSKIRIENNALYFKFDAGFNYGLLNLADESFKSQDGSIHAHNLELNFSIIYPIKKILYDACHNLQ